MKVLPITKTNTTKTTNNNSQTFGNYAKIRIPERLINVKLSFLEELRTMPPKKVLDECLKVTGEIAAEIKKLTNGKVNVYKRTLNDMDYLDKHCRGLYERYLKTLYIEDNNGKDLPEFMKALEYLIKEKSIGCEVYAKDLFAPKKKGILEESNLAAIAYGATPEKMIKL